MCWGVGEVTGDVEKSEGNEVSQKMWGRTVLGPHTLTHFLTPPPFLSPHPFPTRQHTSHSPHTLSHTPPHTSPLPTPLFLPPNTLPYTSPHTSSHSSPHLRLHPNTLLTHSMYSSRPLPTSSPTVSIMWRSYRVTGTM